MGFGATRGWTRVRAVGLLPRAGTIAGPTPPGPPLAFGTTFGCAACGCGSVLVWPGAVALRPLTTVLARAGFTFATLGLSFASWLYDVATNSLIYTPNFDNVPAPVPNGDVVAIVYDAQFPMTVTVEDAGEITVHAGDESEQMIS